MSSKHVSTQLSAYCHDELPPEQSQFVAEHLIGCRRCRAEFEEIKLGVRFAEQVPRVSAPVSLWSETAGALSELSSATSPRFRSRHLPHRLTPGWQSLAAVCAMLILTSSAAWFFRHQRTSAPQVSGNEQLATNDQPAEVRPARGTGPSWEVARLEGAPLIGSNRIEGRGPLGVGEWLETDASSRAQINIPNIGIVDIDPNSRVRLVEASASEHRLGMAHGRMHARISAPPRLFIVETPSAVAIDLGCSYTLEVDKAGRSILHVTAGLVAVALKGRESVVPAGAVCLTYPRRGPGTPYFGDASERFRQALAKLDFQNGGEKSLEIILAEASMHDTLTLWHLLSRVGGSQRARIYDRMAALVAPPPDVTREGVLRLDQGMLDSWKQVLERAWFE